MEKQLLRALKRITVLEEEIKRMKETPHANHKKSIIDVKAFIKLDTFKGVAWHHWSNKMKSLVAQAYPTTGRKILANVELYKEEVDNDTLEADVDIGGAGR